MSRIRMKVFIDNATDVPLRFSSDELLVGDYTPDWRPPQQIAPHSRQGFQGEGSIAPINQAVTGTEGRVRYDIVAPDGGQLYIHWNSPLIESPFGNTFHVLAPPGWEVTPSGGQGHSAELEVRVRRTARRSVPRFHVAGRRFGFGNNWNESLPVISLGFLWNKLFEALPGPLGELGIERVLDDDFVPITRASAGLCGGMVFTVMDYYAAHLLPPEQKTAPSSPDDALFEYIRDRLWDSFDVDGQGHRFLGYSSPHYPNGDEGVIQALGLTRGRSWISFREAWPEIQQDIDAGRLSPVGLIQTDNLDIGDNHQVLAYAYEKSGQWVNLYIYDPNEEDEIKLAFETSATDGEVHVTRTGGRPTNKRIFCFFRINNYVPKVPPAGRRARSVGQALRATMAPPRSLKAALREGNSGASVARWLQSI
jgi:hypothetical protein